MLHQKAVDCVGSLALDIGTFMYRTDLEAPRTSEHEEAPMARAKYKQTLGFNTYSSSSSTIMESGARPTGPQISELPKPCPPSHESKLVEGHGMYAEPRCVVCDAGVSMRRVTVTV